MTTAPPPTSGVRHPNPGPVRVLVALEDPLLQCLLVERLDREDDLAPTVAPASVGGLLASVASDCPDLVVVDLQWAGANASALLDHLSSLPDGPRVLALSADESDAAQLMAARHGARGIVTRAHGPEALPRAIRAVHRGEVWFTRNLSERVFREYHQLFRRVRETERPAGCLTDRERDVLVAVARGLKNQQIADELYMSVHTVKLHMRHILRKLGLPNRTEAAVFAVREGLVSPLPGNPPVSVQRVSLDLAGSTPL